MTPALHTWRGIVLGVLLGLLLWALGLGLAWHLLGT